MKAHLYVFDGWVDWEPAFAIAGINNPQFQREPGAWRVETVGPARSISLHSIGGLAVLPDLAVDDLVPQDSQLLILPGGSSWEEAGAHAAILAKAAQWIERGIPVAAICGATAGLARAGLLDDRPHTSNASTYLKGTGYAGGAHYRDEAAVNDGGLITAGGMAPLEFARAIFQQVALYDDDVLQSWYNLYHTGKSEHFARLVRAAEAHGHA